MTTNILINLSYSALLLSLVFSIAQARAQAVFDEENLNDFISDLNDKSLERHYQLGDKQSAVHAWLVNECMQDRGFDNELSANHDEWAAALYGKYAYCQDHHIDGIDPPCPDESVVDRSINKSCWQSSYSQIDWGHSIMHAARRDTFESYRLDPKDPVVQAIERRWSTCMASHGFSYSSREEAFSASNQSSQENPRAVAIACMENTGYNQSRQNQAFQLNAAIYQARQEEFKALVNRYETAEEKATQAITEYCKKDRNTIVKLYEANKNSTNTICN